MSSFLHSCSCSVYSLPFFWRILYELNSYQIITLKSEQKYLPEFFSAHGAFQNIIFLDAVEAEEKFCIWGSSSIRRLCIFRRRHMV
jgi:hypothetical protein